MKKGEDKTNAIRLVEQKKLSHAVHDYASTEAINALEVAERLGQDPNRVFKTLVTIGKSMEHYVFVVPANKELDLKKAAKAVGEKSIAMIKAKDLLPLTGYIHGGCSPIGMKKRFTTTLHETAGDYETILFSGGKIGLQLEMSLKALQTIIPCTLKDIAEE